MGVISLVDYSFTYPGETVAALDRVTLDVAPGEFVVVCGETGSGKTTLLRTLKPEIAPVGEAKGTLEVPQGIEPASTAGADEAQGERRAGSRSVMGVGFVSQDPEGQIVMDTVRAELAFGLENLGVAPDEIRRRIAEVATFFGIDGWIDRRVADLSGGQKQILNVASVLVMQPTVLVLDEPTAQLDPIATREFLSLIDRVNSELGIAVVMSEHRLEDVLVLADRVVLMQAGAVEMCLPPHEFARELYEKAPSFTPALPASTRLVYELGGCEEAPLTVKEARAWLEGHAGDAQAVSEKVAPVASVSCGRGLVERDAFSETAITAKRIWFRYDRTEGFVLREASLEVARGEVHALLGGNGSGKTTLLKLFAGALKPSRGVASFAKGLVTGMLPQDPLALFATDAVEKELSEWQAPKGYSSRDIESQLQRFGLAHLRNRHPYDLSGGEKQKLALAKVLLLEPDVLLLDEPTKGIDAVSKRLIADVLLERRNAGATILLVTHDLEFADCVADRCSLLFDGEIVSTEPTGDFFDSNLFYTTEERRVLHG